MIWRRDLHHVGDGRVLHVAVPEGYHGGDARYPLLVCFDAQWTFGTACDVALNLGLARILPRVVVVGVGWDATQAREVVRRRAAAFTPTAAEVPDFVAAPGQGSPVRGGDGPAYLRWVLDDVLPFLDRSYRTIPEDRTFIGHSLSALFGTYAMVTEPRSFQRWLLASPSVWWDDRVILQIEERSRASGTSLRGRAFVSVGSEEERGTAFPMITNATELQRRLAERSHDGFESTLQVLDGELHHSTIPAALSRGLRWLFR